MPSLQVVNLPEDPNTQMYNQIGKTLGSGLSSFITHNNANNALNKILDDPNIKKAPVSDRLDALTRALSPYGEVGQGILAERLGIEKQAMQERESQELAKGYRGEQYSARDIQPENLKNLNTRRSSIDVGKNIGAALRSAGVPEELAQEHESIISNTEKGTGQNQAIGDALDTLKRYRQYKEGTNQNQPEAQLGASQVNPEYEFEPLPPDTTPRTPDQRVAHSDALRKENKEKYDLTADKTRSDAQTEGDISRLLELNEKGNLREGYIRYLDIDAEGNLKYPENASADEAEYAKIISRMSGGAKNDFPGRVTNFDLQNFINRLPNLRNTKEGRRAIGESVRIMSKIQQTYTKALKEVYDKYGVDKINYQQADKIASEIAEPLVQGLSQEYKNIDKTMSILSGKEKLKGSDRILVEDPEGKLQAMKKGVKLPKGYKPV